MISLLNGSTSAGGRIAKPSRQPVIAQALREAVEDDRALHHVRHARDRDVLALEDAAAVDLVGHDDDVVLAGDVGDGRDVLARQHAAGRVVRRVEDDQLGLGRDERAQLVDVESEVVLLAQRVAARACRP